MKQSKRQQKPAENDSVWSCSTHNLIRDVPSGTYFARFKVKGKHRWRSCRVVFNSGILWAINSGIPGQEESEGRWKAWIDRFETCSGRGWPGRRKAARPAVCKASVGAQVASPQSPILRRSEASFGANGLGRQAKLRCRPHDDAFDRTDLSGFDRTTTQETRDRPHYSAFARTGPSGFARTTTSFPVGTLEVLA
jgi:hypothetical protein